MTFEEWYKESFPGDWNLAILAKSPPAIERYKMAKSAWQAALTQGDIRNNHWRAFIDRMDDV